MSRRRHAAGGALMLLTACGGGVSTTEVESADGITTTTADPLAGFERAAVLVSGERWEVAVADRADLRARGLMGVEDLGDLDGMLFLWDEDTTASFWMKDTLIPLDVAFFSDDGTLVDLVSMTPCLADPCPQYQASGHYRVALEARAGAFSGIDPLTLVILG